MGDWVLIAELARTKNLQGGFIARSVRNLPFLLEPGLEVAFVPPRLDVPRTGIVTLVSEEPKGGHFVTFDTVQDADTAHALAGCFCLARKTDLPDLPPDAGHDDLSGYEVHDVRAGVIGTVDGVIDNPGQSLLSVKRPGKGSALIPIVDDFILGIDDDARTIEVSVPDGLLDL